MARILQANVNRRREALDLLYKEALESKCDVIAVSEPNKTMVQNSRWVVDEFADAAALILPNGPVVINHGSEPGFVWVETSQFVVYSCYISPNVDITKYENFINSLQSSVRKQSKGIIITGDFNAHSVVWGSSATNKRGEILLDWVAANALVILNDGKSPTFIRRETKSYLDLTICTEEIARNMVEWRVLSGKETLSDHEWIMVRIKETRPQHTAAKHEKKPTGWKIDPSKITDFKKRVKELLKLDGEPYTANEFKEIINKACNEIFEVKRKGNGRRPVYWWTKNISDKRKECIKLRRKMTRENRQNRMTEEQRQEIKHDYTSHRRELTKAIKMEKRNSWKCLIEDLENDIWGQGYKIVAKKLYAPTQTLTTAEKKEHVNELFPTHPLTKWPQISIAHPIKLFTSEELVKALGSLNIGKAPGPDGITTELVKSIAENNSQVMLRMMNKFLIAGVFPDEWKVARLVLLEKPRKPHKITTYRPLCLLNVLGKLLEKLLLMRLEEETLPLSDKQFGFRKGRSTVDAIKTVLQFGEKATAGSYTSRKTCVLIALDIQNAFNSLPWKQVVKALQVKNTPPYLLRMIYNYLSDRWLFVDEEKIQITCGAPQGSVLGPFLWNICYDEILNTDLGEGCELVAFADDLAAIVTARNAEEVQAQSNFVIEILKDKIEDLGLKLAPEKTEVLVLQKKRRNEEIRIRIGDDELCSKDHIKYLGCRQE